MIKRTDIRAAVKTVCEGIEGFSADTVFLGRQRSLPGHLLPAICIYGENEEKARDMGLPRRHTRGMDIMIEIHVRADTTAAVENTLDDYCALLESAMLADESLGGLVEDLMAVLDEYDIDEDSREPAGVAACRYSIQYTG